MSLGDIAEALAPPQARAAILGGKGAVYLIGGLVALLLLGLAVWWVFLRPAQEHRAAVQSGITAKAADSQVEAAKDGIATGDRVQIVHDRIERITRENTTRILAAPGADAAVSADVDAAWLAALCVRNAYLNDPACAGVLRAPAVDGDTADPGRADPDGP